MPTLATLAAALANGSASSHSLVEACLEKIEDPAGEGRTTFLHVDRKAALAQADAMDQLRSSGAAPSPFAGIPVSIKDLFDIAGQVTRAGSTALANRPAATRDATCVARLRRAGFVLIGRSNMSEFAFSGLGLNPHYGTPRNPWERTAGLAPAGDFPTWDFPTGDSLTDRSVALAGRSVTARRARFRLTHFASSRSVLR